MVATKSPACICLFSSCGLERLAYNEKVVGSTPATGTVKYVQTIKGKEEPFRFQNKKAEAEYIDICEILWGCVPCDVNWAIGTNLYKKEKGKTCVCSLVGRAIDS